MKASEESESEYERISEQSRPSRGAVGASQRRETPKTTDSEDWEEQIRKNLSEIRTSSLTESERIVRTQEWIVQFIRTVRTAAYESGYSEGQKHAFGVDRTHVKREGYESALREALKVVPVKVPETNGFGEPQYMARGLNNGIEMTRQAIERLLDT